MTDREGFEEAVGMAKETPTLGIGLHLDLDSFFNVEHGVGRLLSYKDPSLPLDAIAKETERQILKILSTGLPVHHVDGHHHSHLRPELIATVAALTAKHKIKVLRYFDGFYKGLYPNLPTAWVRDMITRFGLRCTDTFFAGWEPVASSLPGYDYLDLSKSFETAELMVHPGKAESWRERELCHCTSSNIRDALRNQKVELINFAQLS